MKITHVFMIGALLVLTGCTATSSNSQKQEERILLKTSTYVTDEMKNNAINPSLIICGIAYTPEVLNEYATDIALVTIKSLDKADMDFFAFVPGTYGNFVVEDTIVGNMENGKEYQYVKPGGYVTEKEFEKNDDPEAIAKRNRLRENSKEKLNTEQYYNVQLDGDIEIEAGKTYLAYFTYHEDKDIYEIIGLGNGLREVEEDVSNGNIIKIKDNETGSFESLEEHIENSIKPYQNI